MFRFLLGFAFLFSHSSSSAALVPQSESFTGTVGVDFYLGWISGKIKALPALDFIAGPLPIGEGVWNLVGNNVDWYNGAPSMMDHYWSKSGVEVSYGSPGIFSLELADFEDGKSSIPVQLLHNSQVELFQGNELVGNVKLGEPTCFAIDREYSCSELVEGDYSTMSVPPGGGWLVFGGNGSSIVLEKDFVNLVTGYIDLNFKIL